MFMRVIAGKYKGRKLNFESTEILRPTADAVKEALFTKLQFLFPIDVFVDLFAGTGSIGIEALSRGAKKVFFVEKNHSHVKIIESNLKTLGIDYDKNNPNSSKQAIILTNDFSSVLENFDQKIDIIFIDPPYKSDFYDKSLQILHEKQLLCENGIVVLELEENKKFCEHGFRIFSDKRYGRKHLIYLENSDE